MPARFVARKEVPDPDNAGARPSRWRRTTPARRGPATPVDDRVSFAGLEGEAEVDTDRQGDIYFVTISNPTQSALSWWAAGGRSCDVVTECSAEPEIDFYTYDELYPTRSRTQERRISLQMMRTSSQVAQYVALQALGFDATINPGNVVVADLVCLEEAADGTCTTPAPAASVLEPGDTLLTIDGMELTTVDDLIAALGGQAARRRRRARDRPRRARRADRRGRADDVAAGSRADDRRVRARSTRQPSTCRSRSPSTPSASVDRRPALAFTLTLIDELSPGDLTGGADVAVTGTIELDGSIGAIGGLPQKASAVRQAGVSTFLVPADAERRRHRQGPRDRRRRRRDHPGGDARRGARRARSASAAIRSRAARLIAANGGRRHVYASRRGHLVLAP